MHDQLFRHISAPNSLCCILPYLIASTPQLDVEKLIESFKSIVNAKTNTIRRLDWTDVVHIALEEWKCHWKGPSLNSELDWLHYRTLPQLAVDEVHCSGDMRKTSILIGRSVERGCSFDFLPLNRVFSFKFDGEELDIKLIEFKTHPDDGHRLFRGFLVLDKLSDPYYCTILVRGLVVLWRIFYASYAALNHCDRLATILGPCELNLKTEGIQEIFNCVNCLFSDDVYKHNMLAAPTIAQKFESKDLSGYLATLISSSLYDYMDKMMTPHELKIRRRVELEISPGSTKAYQFALYLEKVNRSRLLILGSEHAYNVEEATFKLNYAPNGTFCYASGGIWLRLFLKRDNLLHELTINDLNLKVYKDRMKIVFCLWNICRLINFNLK